MFRNVPACSGMFHVPGFIDGPTKEYPDPISAVASKEKVSLSVFPFIILFVICNISCRA